MYRVLVGGRLLRGHYTAVPTDFYVKNVHIYMISRVSFLQRQDYASVWG